MIDMRKLFLFIMACLSLSSIQAQSKQEKEFGFFNSLAIGANVGTTGWGIDVATPLGNHLALRAGFTIMPTLTKNITRAAARTSAHAKTLTRITIATTVAIRPLANIRM